MIEIITMILSWVIVVLQLMINHSITKYRTQVSDLQRDNAQLYADVFALKLYIEDLYDDKKRQEYVQKMKSKMLKQFSKEADGYFDNEDKG